MFHSAVNGTMFPFLFWISISLGALVFLFLFWPRKRYFPGPPMIGVFGILLEAIPNMSRRHLHHLELRRRFGPVIQINRSTQPAILLTEPEDVKCLVENRDVFPDRPVSQRVQSAHSARLARSRCRRSARTLGGASSLVVAALCREAHARLRRVDCRAG
jgi:hypothetical protein